MRHSIVKRQYALKSGSQTYGHNIAHSSTTGDARMASMRTFPQIRACCATPQTFAAPPAALRSQARRSNSCCAQKKRIIQPGHLRFDRHNSPGIPACLPAAVCERWSGGIMSHVTVEMHFILQKWSFSRSASEIQLGKVVAYCACVSCACMRRLMSKAVRVLQAHLMLQAHLSSQYYRCLQSQEANRQETRQITASWGSPSELVRSAFNLNGGLQLCARGLEMMRSCGSKQSQRL